MKKFFLCWLLLSFYSISLPVVIAQPDDSYLIATLDIFVQRTLQAYNHDDHIMFYKYFAKQMDPIAAKRFFDAEYVSMHKNLLGPVIEKRLLLDKSTLDHDLPELVYQARFEKFNPVLVTVNFINQHDEYRITRIRFDRIYNGSVGSVHVP